MRKERNNYCVYKHTLPDGRCYIGATNRGKERWGYEGCNYRNHPLFYSLICQIGWSNIKHEILIEDLSKEDAQRLEKRLIIEAKENKISLNRLSGGYCMTERGHRTEETKRKIGEKNSHPHSQEAIVHFRESSRWRFRPVRVYKDKTVVGEFENAYQASIALGIEKSYVYAALKRKSHYTSGYVFEELENKTKRGQPKKHYPRTPRIDPTTNKIRCIRRGSENPLAKPILQYSKDGAFIKEWGSTTEVFNALNISGSAIANCLAGLSRTAGGYVWKHK